MAKLIITIRGDDNTSVQKEFEAENVEGLLHEKVWDGVVSKKKIQRDFHAIILKMMDGISEL